MLQSQVGTAWTGLGQNKKTHITIDTVYRNTLTNTSSTHTHVNNETSLTQTTLPLSRRKQVKQASLPRTPVPPRRTLGSSYSALPVEPHSCQTRGCMWNTSSDRVLSSGKCLRAGHSHPCTQNKVEWDKLDRHLLENVCVTPFPQSPYLPIVLLFYMGQ